MGGDGGVRAKRLRKHDTPVLIDRKNVHISIERDRQLVSLIRIIRQAIEKPVDLLCKALAACIEGRSIERGVAVDAARIAIALEPGAERGRHRDPTLGIELVGECRDKAVHPSATRKHSAFAAIPIVCRSARGSRHGPRTEARGKARLARQPCAGVYGFTWYIMGVNGQWRNFVGKAGETRVASCGLQALG